MSEKIFKSLIAIVLIITLTMANFIAVSFNLVTYAVAVLSEQTPTNQKNVTFDVYFKDENETAIQNKQEKIDNENLKLYMQIAVKNEGYFNGEVSLEKSNFRLKNDIQSERINKIEENKIFLNQINAGEVAEIEVGIEAIKDNRFDLSLLNMASEISINGIYKDSSSKDRNVQAKREVTLNLTNPYEENEGTVLSSQILTNKVFEINGENKRVVQVLIESGLQDNRYPVKETSIEVSAINDAELIDVISRGTKATNGKNEIEFNEKNWIYDEENNIVKISVNNAIENGTISWEKGITDSYVVTYILPENTEVAGKDINLKSNIKLYDQTETIKTANTSVKIEEELDRIIDTKTETLEQSIYKGKLYSGEDRNYEVIENIYVSNSDVKKSINTQLVEATFETKDSEVTSNIQYSYSILDKTQINRVLGEDGYIKLGDTKINKESQADENGQIIVNYPEETKSISIESSEVKNSGIISVKSVKTIKKQNYDKAVINNLQAIKENNSKIELKESELVTKLEVNKEYLYTMADSTEMEIRAVLQTNSEQNNLYKNPVLKVVLPRQVQEVNVNKINLLFEDELKIETANIHEENGQKVIEVRLSGEQTKHKDNTIEETTIIINTNVVLNKEATNSNESIKLQYVNENEQKEVEKTISIIAPSGVIVKNSISEYGISTIGEEENRVVKLDLATEAKQAQVNIEIINNNGNIIENAKILGEFPTSDTLGATVTELNIPGTTVYYSENADATEDLNNNVNAWATSISNPNSVKKYLIVIPKMDIAQKVVASYVITIPENLGYNKTATEGYKVIYTNIATGEENISTATSIELTTGKGPELAANLTAQVGQNELKTGDEVLSGEVIKYSLEISNTGTEKAENVQILGKVPEGTNYIEQEKTELGGTNGIYTEKEVNEYINKIDSINAGETKLVEYEVKVKEQNKEISNRVDVQYNEAVVSTPEIVLKSQNSDLSISLSTNPTREEKVYAPGSSMEYYAEIKNETDKTINNVSLDWSLPEDTELMYQEMIYNFKAGNQYEEKMNNSKTVTIQKIEANSSKLVHIVLKVNENIEGTKILNISATVKSKGNECKSNILQATASGINNMEISISSDKENSYIYAGDEIKYTINVKNNNDVNVYGKITDKIPSELSITKVTVNGEPYSMSNFVDNEVVITKDLVKGQNNEIVVTTVVNFDETQKAGTIVNKAQVNAMNIFEKTSSEVSNILLAKVANNESIENKDINDNEYDSNIQTIINNNQNDATDNVINVEENNNTYMISGIAWFDENKNGQKDPNEPILPEIEVKLIDVVTGNVVKTEKTNNKGFYLFSDVEKGQYLVQFEYDTEVYTLTAYQKEGTAPSYNSDVVTKELTIAGEMKNYAVTDTITIADNNIANVDLGLINSTTFDMEVEKTVNKMVVQNSKGTQAYEFGNSTLAKIEIKAKDLAKTNVIVEYQIKVKNNGEIAGYVRNVADYLPTDLKFSSELNKDWYQSGNTLYNTSLANTKIEPGETKTLTLVLTKSMTEENTGRFYNGAELIEIYNELGLKDVDSTPANKAQNEDDYGSADIIIGVATGAMTSYISLTISILALIAIASYFIHRKVDKDHEIKVNL